MKQSETKTPETAKKDVAKLTESNQIFSPNASNALLGNKRRPVKKISAEEVSTTLADRIVGNEKRKQDAEEGKSPEVIATKRRRSGTVVDLGEKESLHTNPLRKVSSKVKGEDIVKGETVSPAQTREIV